MNRKLAPVRNVRRVTPRCCATCTCLVVSHGSLACGRPDGPAFETGDRNDLLLVCDRWQSAYNTPSGAEKGDA